MNKNKMTDHFVTRIRMMNVSGPNVQKCNCESVKVLFNFKDKLVFFLQCLYGITGLVYVRKCLIMRML